MLQRIGLAQSILNHPELVILDEPTSGLDPVGRRLVRDIIKDLSRRGTTIFLNSHFLSEVEITCNRVAFIKKGEIIKISSLYDLFEGMLRVELKATRLNPEVISGLSNWCSDIQVENGYLTFQVNGESKLPEINRYLIENHVEVYSLRPQQLSLEDLFIQIVGSEGEL